jgi:uncharacterized protein (DUF488 family)
VSGILLYTAGHSNRTVEDLLGLLAEAGVGVVVDVRRVPYSGRWPQFRREPFAAALAAAGVDYVWEGDALGGRRDWTPAAARHRAIEDRSFAAYAAHMETDEFRAGMTRMLALAGRVPVAVLCAERSPANCHRAFIADHLVAAGAEVLHLLGGEERERHRLQETARVCGTSLVYDRSAQCALDLGPAQDPRED